MKNKGWLVIAIIFFVLTLGIVFYFGKLNSSGNNLCEYAYVEKVYDGDTVYTDKLGKARLIGIDAPEIYHSGWTRIKSYKFYSCGNAAKKLAEKYLYHKEILFCKDPIGDNKGGYGRYLRYAMILSGNKQVPLGYIEIQKGLAKVYEKANFIWKEKYKKAQKQAKQEHIGIWSEKCILEDKKIKEKFGVK